MPRRVLSLLFVLSFSIATPAWSQTLWSQDDARELLAVVEEVRADGLDPADYDANGLGQDLAGGNPAAWSLRATSIFLRLASDLSMGHVRNRRSVAWHIAGPSLDADGAQALLATALAAHQVRETLKRLLPQHRQYAMLKAALANSAPRDKAGIQRLRANLERWRWMPRELGRRYLLVNVPAFTVSLVEDGRVIERRRVIVGKPRTPTPQFAANVTGMILNPWWEVPQSIVRESVGALLRTNPALAHTRGYVVSAGKVRQAPGPANALGRIKLVMPNPFTVYLHDTPSRNLFDADVRAFSHGCIRTDDALGLAASLLGNGSQSRAEIDRALAAGVSRQIDLPETIPVYVVYFTAAAEDNGEIATFPDIYGRDGPVVVGLIDREPENPGP